MKEIWNLIQLYITLLGGWIGYYLGGIDGFINALVAFVVLDYITGVLVAILNHQLSSAVGFKGILKKVIIFALVGVGNILDMYIIGEGSTIRTAIIFFYISNEGVSLLENCTALGLPIPEKLKTILEQIGKEGYEDGNSQKNK